MKKALAAALAMALLMASPTFAKKQAAADAPSKCVSVEKIEKEAAAKQVKIEYKIVGDELAKLNAYVLKKSDGRAPPIPGTSAVLILSTPDAEAWLGVVFVNGCVARLFPVNPIGFKKLYDNAQGDGEI
jgi:hypothetical protein